MDTMKMMMDMGVVLRGNDDDVGGLGAHVSLVVLLRAD